MARIRKNWVGASVLGWSLLVIWNGLSGGSIAWGQSPDHIFELDSRAGLQGETLTVTTRLEILPGGLPIDGFSYGVCHDFNEVQPVSSTLANDILTANFAGNPPDFSQVFIDPGGRSSAGGVVHGLVICLSLCATLSPGSVTDILNIEYELVGPPGTVAALDYCDDAMFEGGEIAATVVVNGSTSLVPTVTSGTLTIENSEFVRGDNDGDGSLTVNDSILLLGHLYMGLPEPDCRDAADSNDNGLLDITDAMYSLTFLFCCGAPPPAPGPGCGEDPTPDTLDCVGSPAC